MDPETAQRIERLEYQVALLYRHLNLGTKEGFLPSPPPAASPASGEPQDSTPGSAVDPRLPPEFFAAMANNKKIQAIKIYRAVTGVGLKEAKDYVDSLDSAQRRRR